MSASIGVDFGGTRIKAGRVEAGSVRDHASLPTPAGATPSAVLDAVARAVKEVGGAVDAVGLAIPGEVDARGRCWRLPNVPGFEGVEIRAELEARLGLPVVVENDATTAALGERIYGHGQTVPSFLLTTLGTGIGGGLVVDGAVRRGRSGFAAETGHVLIDSAPDAWPCPCGRRGCVEAYAGTRGLLRRYAELGGADNVTPADVAAAARRGERAALDAFAAMGRALGIALAQVQKVLDLDALVFSGGISRSFDLIEPTLRTELRVHVHGPPTAEIPLLVSELGEHAGIIGAAELPRLATMR